MRRLEEVIASHGLDVVEAGFAALRARTEARMRAAIRAIPDGRYRFADVMDGDGIDAYDIPIVVEVSVEGERIRFDFAGTAPQVPGSINVTLNATIAAVGYALKALVDPEVPNNQGMLDVLEVEAEPGTLVNAVFPAPVSSRAHTSQRIIDVVLGALAQALPERAVAAANGANSMAVFAGTDQRTGRPFVYLETLGGGMGGRPMKDGKDGVQVGITNTSNLPVEAIELEYPLLVEEYSLIPDSGGAGTHRGGLGLRRVVRPLGQSVPVQRRRRALPSPALGPVRRRPRRVRAVPDRRARRERRRIHDKPGEIRLGPEQALVVETPGAGGYGPPSGRSAEAKAEDRASGKFSAGVHAAPLRRRLRRCGSGRAAVGRLDASRSRRAVPHGSRGRPAARRRPRGRSAGSRGASRAGAPARRRPAGENRCASRAGGASRPRGGAAWCRCRIRGRVGWVASQRSTKRRGATAAFERRDAGGCTRRPGSARSGVPPQRLRSPISSTGPCGAAVRRMKAASSAIWRAADSGVLLVRLEVGGIDVESCPRPRREPGVERAFGGEPVRPGGGAEGQRVARDDGQARGERQLVVDQRQEGRRRSGSGGPLSAVNSAPEARREGLPQASPWRCSAARSSRAAAVVDGLLQRDHVEAGERGADRLGARR